MKTGIKRPATVVRRHGRWAFTLTEVMLSTAVFSVCVAAVLSANLFGYKMFNLAAAKLSATDNSRKVISLVANEIRQGKIIQIGTWNQDTGSFSNAPDGTPQMGNTLRIYPGTDTNRWVVYFGDPAAQTLNRFSSIDSNVAVVASYVTNHVLFQAEDYLGNVLSRDQNNRIICLKLEFWQWEFPVANAGLGGWYDYNRLHTKVTRRAIE